MSVPEWKAFPWSLWRRQAAALLRLELARSFLSGRAWWIYLLALGPVLLTGAHSVLASKGKWSCSLTNDNMAYAVIFQLFYLRLGIFFGCVGIFASLFRDEVLEKTLHCYFLAPVRRELVLISKYAAGLLTALVFFGGSVAVSFFLITLHFGPRQQEFLFRGPGLAQLGWYVLTAALACVGYGAVFLVCGLLFKNPMIPAAAVWLWEALNPFLPSLLKKLSVVFYLKSLCPLEVPLKGPLALIAVTTDPTPAWLAIPGLLAVSLAVLFFAGHQVRRMEISYSE